MDTTLQVVILREHSQHIRQLATTLDEVLQKFEQAMSEPSGGAANARELLDEVRNLNDSLFAAADIFYQRLGRFIETRKIGSGSTPAN